MNKRITPMVLFSDVSSHHAGGLRRIKMISHDYDYYYYYYSYYCIGFIYSGGRALDSFRVKVTPITEGFWIQLWPTDQERLLIRGTCSSGKLENHNCSDCIFGVITFLEPGEVSFAQGETAKQRPLGMRLHEPRISKTWIISSASHQQCQSRFRSS